METEYQITVILNRRGTAFCSERLCTILGKFSFSYEVPIKLIEYILSCGRSFLHHLWRLHSKWELYFITILSLSAGHSCCPYHLLDKQQRIDAGTLLWWIWILTSLGFLLVGCFYYHWQFHCMQLGIKHSIQTLQTLQIESFPKEGVCAHSFNLSKVLLREPSVLEQ